MGTRDDSGAPASRRVLAWSLSAVVLVVAGCTSTDPETEERLDAAIEQSEELTSGDDVLADATPEQRQCVEDTLVGSDLSPIQILADTSASGVEARIEVTRITIGCIPNLGEVDSYATNFTEQFTPALGPGADVDATEGGCLLQYVIDNADDPAEMLIAGTSDDLLEVLGGAIDVCFDETSRAAIAGEAGTGPQAYGDNADLDSLYDACDRGDERACDLLFVNVSEDSEYWLLAIDCAGRGGTDGFCTEGIVAAADGFADPSSPGLAVLMVDCEAGDMIACDTLFGIAPIGSVAENTGYTCGDRIAVGAIPNCRTRFPS